MSQGNLSPKNKLPNDLVADMLMDALDKEIKVLKVRADLGNETSRGFLLKHESGITVLTQNTEDGGFNQFDGNQLKGRLASMGEMSREEGFTVKQALTQVQEKSVTQDGPFQKLQSGIKSAYETMAAHIDMPPLLDDGKPSPEPDLKNTNRFTQNIERWYEDLGQKMSGVAQRLSMQAEDLPLIKEAMQSTLKGFDAFDVQSEAKGQYHKQKPTLMAALESQIETNNILIKEGALVKLDYDEPSQRLMLTMYNQAMEPVASAVSQSIPLSQAESKAPEDLEEMFGEGSRVVSDVALFEDARWQPHEDNQIDIGPVIDVLSQTELGNSGLIVNSQLIDMDNEHVNVEKYDIYADVMAEAAKDLSKGGATVIASNQLTRPDNAKIMTPWLSQTVKEAMDDVTSQMKVKDPSQNIPEFGFK